MALLAGAVALAQQMPSGQQPGIPGQQPQQSTSPTVGAPGAYPGTAPTGQDFGDKAFVSKAMEGDNTQVQLGQLAQEKSQSADVKQLAQKLASDHSQMNDKWFKPVAQQLGVSEPEGPSKKNKKTVAKLQNLSGPDFDSEYLTMMWKNHQQDLKLFQEEAKLAQDPNVRQVAEQGANVIEQHLQLIEQVARNHNVALNEKSKQTPSM
jgi:putative membrane protein